MPLFPRIQSPCPYKDRLGAVMDGDFCRMCRRSVVDLTAFSDGERIAFLAGCEEEVCVSYRLPRAAIGAAALAAATLALPTAAAAQDSPAVAEALAEVPVVETDAVAGDDMTIMVGGIKDPRHVEFAAVGDEPSAPELPVVYEDEKAPKRAPEPPVRKPAGS
jgi:predicted Fe-S protein YdhL (DUF1289 family)